MAILASLLFVDALLLEIVLGRPLHLVLQVTDLDDFLLLGLRWMLGKVARVDLLLAALGVAVVLCVADRPPLLLLFLG